MPSKLLCVILLSAAAAHADELMWNERSERRELHSVTHVVEKAGQAAGRRRLDLTADNLGDVGPALLVEGP